jgi:DNA polymerase-3 subunit delta
VYGNKETDTMMPPQNAVLTDIKKGHISSCYLLYGEEEFLIKQTLNNIINQILPENDRDLNLFSMDGELVDMDDLCRSLLMPPLIAGRKVVVLRNTHLFRSETVSTPELIGKVRNLMESNPKKAAREFVHFLRIMGWDLDDMKDGGWKTIRDDDWRKAMGDDAGKTRDEWLPAIIEICINSQIKEEQSIESTDCLSDILTKGLPEGNHLILTAGSVDKRKKLFKTISDMGKVLYFPQDKI